MISDSLFNNSLGIKISTALYKKKEIETNKTIQALKKDNQSLQEKLDHTRSVNHGYQVFVMVVIGLVLLYFIYRYFRRRNMRKEMLKDLEKRLMERAR